MRTLLILICIHGIQALELVLQGHGSVNIGESLSLSCNATELESAPSTIVWFKGFDKVLKDDRISVTSLQSPRAITSKLTINAVTKQDAGKYKCWLSNQDVRQKIVKVVDNSQTGADSGAMGRQLSSASNFILSIFVSILFCRCI